MNRIDPHVDTDAGYWRVAVVEDHLLQRRGLVAIFGQQHGLRVIFEGETLPEFLTWLGRTPAAERPHLLVLDLLVDRGPSAEPDAVRRLVNDGIKVLVVSALTSPPLVRRVLRAGVTGVVGKRDSAEDVVAAAWTVIGRGRWMTTELAQVILHDEGRPVLSDQEERALVLYSTGKTLDQVATVLGVKRATAKTYLDRVKAKYASAGRPVRTKVDLARTALADGYLDAPPPAPKPA
jgi:DNA-binding NarL/FixJ family response regulator